MVTVTKRRQYGLRVNRVAHRGTGPGAKLLNKAERYGKEQGAVISFLKTEKAKGFYEKNGYQVFGVLEDRPIGSFLYHMKKRLD
ncbi:MAG: GNAT family N-acetyltransferase [Saccharospirillum sp.]|nr:GNAT family N-acetyltransferase [Saccharospirillum sp.]